MTSKAEKSQKSGVRSVAESLSRKENGSYQTFQIVDNRPEAAAQLKIQELINSHTNLNETSQLKSITDKRDVNRTMNESGRNNKTGLPDNLKAGVENLSGYMMDDVKVHYNSDKPAQLQSLAYAQGTDIHIGPGQEKHLPHEAWHVVQQKQGRVKPTIQKKDNVKINDDPGLENEADEMGRKAVLNSPTAAVILTESDSTSTPDTIQRMVGISLNKDDQVFDIDGNRGLIVEFIFDPRNPRYIVNFNGTRQIELSCQDLFIEPPETERSSYFDHEDSMNEYDSSDETPLLAEQHARRSGIFKKYQEGKKRRPGKFASDSSKNPKGKFKSFSTRLKGEFSTDVSSVTERNKTYTDKGSLMATHAQVTKGLDATIGNPILTPVESSITAPVSAILGTNRRAGRTPGTRAIIEVKVGHLISAAGSLIQTIPVAGAIGGPVSGMGTYLQEHGRGASKEQALLKGLAATGAGSLAGLIPGYGSYSGMVGLINDCRSLASNVDIHGDPAYASALLERIKEMEALMEEMRDEDMQGWDKIVEKEVRKTYRRLAKEMRRREKQERGQYGAKRGLLESDAIFDSDSEDEGTLDFN